MKNPNHTFQQPKVILVRNSNLFHSHWYWAGKCSHFRTDEAGIGKYLVHLLNKWLKPLINCWNCCWFFFCQPMRKTFQPFVALPDNILLFVAPEVSAVYTLACSHVICKKNILCVKMQLRSVHFYTDPSQGYDQQYVILHIVIWGFLKNLKGTT